MSGRALMVQGTSSHVGKSVLAAGLCRFYRQEGLRVVPFKAQNMALNSFATPDGLEIGRAQAVQAEAAGVLPSVDMNPILLKPEGSSRSQVVVLGKPIGTMDAWEYHRRTNDLWPTVEGSLRRLLDENDLVVIEGAGSPVEVNLRASDIVNMRVARAVQAAVLLVADIDRGGVFASLVGTMALLEPEEQALVAGFIINKFRGDLKLFHAGIEFLEARLSRPVLGVVPWIQSLGIAQEDSLGLPPAKETGALDAAIDVAVVRLPHIANFDDFDPLAARPGVRVRFVDAVAGFGAPDLVVLPGTKTTRADLEWVRGRGLDRAILGHAAKGGMMLGICGGYQMLGERIEDPDGVEGDSGASFALSLLPAVTWYATEKSTVQVRGNILSPRGPLGGIAGARIAGYEIHMGRTECEAEPLFSLDGGRAEGAISTNGRVLGTYLHGLFHNPLVTDAIIASLCRQKGIPIPAQTEESDPYDLLAEVLRGSLQVPMLRRLGGMA